MDAARIEKLQQFVNLCESDLSILNDPSVSFFRSYIESLGGKVPPSSIESKPYVVEEYDKNVEVPQDEEEDEIVESDIGFKGETVEPDIDPPQKWLLSGNLEEAIEQLTRAILLNPASDIMYATRATVYIKMKKPNAAIRDADAALKINPDSAKGYKSHGIARTMLGQWEEAAKDLHVASKLDYDEEISYILKKVEPNANKIEDRRRKYDKLQKEREDKKSEREKQRRRAEAKAAYENAKKQEQASSSEKPSGFPGGMPGGIDYSKILNDPELMTAFQDPEVMAALQICKEKPANLANHQANPKVAHLLSQK